MGLAWVARTRMCDVVEADKDGQRRTSYDKVQGLMKLIEARTDSHMSLGENTVLLLPCFGILGDHSKSACSSRE